MPIGEMPQAEVSISVELVRELLADQRPDLVGHSLAILAEGWDNVSFRIGAGLVARLPRREVAAGLLAVEQRWLPELAPSLPLPIPVPRFVGEPGHGYPWHWSICDFLPGSPAAFTPPSDMARAADVLGSFLGALHVPAPSEAPSNPVRGGPLRERDPVFRTRLEQISELSWVDPDRAIAVWERALAAPVFEEERVWVHGDLHPQNILVADGLVSAVVDFGDLNGGDPATDIAIAWMMFDAGDRARLRAGHGRVDDATWERGRGWALHLGVSFVAASADNPTMGGIGKTAVERVLADREAEQKP